MSRHLNLDSLNRGSLAVSAIAMYLGLSASAIADTIGYSYLELDNFIVSDNATGVQLDDSDFSTLDIGNSSSASAISTFGAPGVTASPSSLETALACSGLPATCAAIAENDSAQQAVSNFSRGDTFGNSGTIVSGLPGPDFVNVFTVAEGRQNTDGTTTGQSGTRNATEFSFMLAADTEIRIDFDGLAELYVQLDQDLVQAQASYNWNASIIEVDTGAVVFSWVPNGVVGGITGGTELLDAFSMNASRGLVSTGADGTGLQSGAFAALVTLAGQTNYRLTIGHGSQINTEVEIVPVAALGDRVWEDLNADGIQDCLDDGDGIIGGPGDVGPECGTGIANVTVTLVSNPDGDAACDSGDEFAAAATVTDADGFYEFLNLDPNQDYCVLFDKNSANTQLDCNSIIGAATFSPQDQGGDDALDSDPDAATGQTGNISLNAGDFDRTWDAGLYCPAKIGDSLILDENADGIQDPTEPGIDGQMVELIECVGGVPGGVIDTTTTDTVDGIPGMYMFNPLPPGEYAVRFINNGPPNTVFSPKDVGGDETTDCDTDGNGLTECVVLGPNEYNQDVDACVFQTAGLGDFVWEDKNADGIQDIGEPGIPDVTVNLFTNGDCSGIPADSMLTGADGGYLFPDLVPGDYCVEFEKPDICDPIIGGASSFSPQDQGGDDAKDSDADPLTGQTGPINLGTNELDLTNDAGVFCPAKIGDFVWNDFNEDGIQDGGEPGIDGVTVNLLDCGPDGILGTGDDGGQLDTTFTDAAGMYMFNPLAPGNYAIEFVLPAGFEFSPQDAGGDDTKDSDADTVTGQTACTNLESNEYDDTVDAGMFEPQEPSIDIEKATNGVDADDPNAGDAPQLNPGDPVTWSYKVTNTGNVTLFNVMVVDDQGVAVICPMDTLVPGEMMTCTANGTAEDLVSTGFTTVPGLCGSVPESPLYENMGTATGETNTGEFVEDVDSSHYCNVECEIEVAKQCRVLDQPVCDDSGKDSDKDKDNDKDKDDDSGSDGDTGKDNDKDKDHDGGTCEGDGNVEYVYTVTNIGNTPVTGITVEDDQLGTINGSFDLPVDDGSGDHVVMLTQAAFISEFTENTATVTSDNCATVMSNTIIVDIGLLDDDADKDQDKDKDHDGDKDKDSDKDEDKDDDGGTPPGTPDCVIDLGGDDDNDKDKDKDSDKDDDVSTTTSTTSTNTLSRPRWWSGWGSYDDSDDDS